MPARNQAGAMSEAECWRRLASAKIGRFVVESGGGPKIFPVNYVLNDKTISFRSGFGEKVDESWTHPRVVFEVDGSSDGTFWSVIVHGTANMLADDDPAVPESARTLVPADPAPKHIVFIVTPDQVTGRLFHSNA